MFFLPIIVSCVYSKPLQKQLEKEWKGRHTREVLSAYGKPDYINTKDVLGTTMFIYVTTDFTPDIPQITYQKISGLKMTVSFIKLSLTGGD